MPTFACRDCCNGDSAGTEEQLLLREIDSKATAGTESLPDGVVLSAPEVRTSSREPFGDRAEPVSHAEKEMQEQVQRFLEHEARLSARLKDATSLVARITDEVKDTEAQRKEVEGKINEIHLRRHLVPKRPGPLDWVDSSWFGAVCNIVVALNLTFMAKHQEIHDMAPVFEAVADQLFLVWYVVELTFKIMHHKKHFFVGKLTAVCWNWLDFGIVGGGIVDQWMMPLVGASGGGSFLSVIRLLRLFRILRFLKIVKAFLVSDLSWIGESKAFDLFMSGVVGVNGITISFELDLQWSGWFWVDNVFLVVYSFDLALRLKRWGCYFFIHPGDIYWNWLDFVVVSAGMLDSWLMPIIALIQVEMFGVTSKLDTSKLTKVMSLMKLMRLLRVLRLVRVLRSIPPLYTLLVGVIDAFKSMQWVILLTLLTLYGGAIVFTNLVGKGLIYPDQVPTPEALEMFGSVLASLFSLFELMNGDTSVIEPIKDLTLGRLLFAAFMVISNWAILAILTAVVSENMMTASNKFLDEEDKRIQMEDEKKNHDKLIDIFEDNDDEKNGIISKKEWEAMLNDETTLMELSEDTHLTKADLVDLFDCLSVEGDEYTGKVQYEQLIHSLKANSALADKRAIMHVMLRLRLMQGEFKTSFEEMKKMMKDQQEQWAFQQQQQQAMLK